jgi:hypothetical protein
MTSMILQPSLYRKITMPNYTDIIIRGQINRATGDSEDYEIFHGWNILRSAECDKEWTSATLDLLNHIHSLELSEVDLMEVLDSIQTEDQHWIWKNKSLAFRTAEYEWFYLYSEGKPQGACVIYHPKASHLETGNKFYVEYIAVAPWNRTCKVQDRKFKSVGTILLQCALNYSIDILKLTPGFSLHSLPQAGAYYTRLKMVHIPSMDKGGLAYYELPQTEAVKLIYAA